MIDWDKNREEDHRQFEVRVIPGASPRLPVIDVSLKVRELQTGSGLESKMCMQNTSKPFMPANHLGCMAVSVSPVTLSEP